MHHIISCSPHKQAVWQPGPPSLSCFGKRAVASKKLIPYSLRAKSEALRRDRERVPGK